MWREKPGNSFPLTAPLPSLCGTWTAIKHTNFGESIHRNWPLCSNRLHGSAFVMPPPSPRKCLHSTRWGGHWCMQKLHFLPSHPTCFQMGMGSTVQPPRHKLVHPDVIAYLHKSLFFFTSGNLGLALFNACEHALTAWASSCSKRPCTFAASQILQKHLKRRIIFLNLFKE